MKGWFIGLLNATISGATSGGTAMLVGIGWKKALIVLGASAGVSLFKWLAQHPIPVPQALNPNVIGQKK